MSKLAARIFRISRAALLGERKRGVLLALGSAPDDRVARLEYSLQTFQPKTVCRRCCWRVGWLPVCMQDKHQVWLLSENVQEVLEVFLINRNQFRIWIGIEKFVACCATNLPALPLEFITI